MTIPPEVRLTADIYIAAMDEIKLRLKAIDGFLKVVRATKEPWIGVPHAEAAVLQIRYICEILALGTLVAHGTPFKDKWNADDIFTQLSKVNAKCFPQAFVMNGHRLQVTGALTLQDIKRIYGRCGDILHRGNLKKGHQKLMKELDPNEITSWVIELDSTLENHMLELPTDAKFIVHMDYLHPKVRLGYATPT